MLIAFAVVSLAVCALCFAVGAGAFPGPLDASQQLASSQDLTVGTTNLTTDVDLGEGFAPQPIAPVRIVLNVEALNIAEGGSVNVTIYESSDDDTYTSTGLTVAVTATGIVQAIAGLTKRYVRATAVLAGAQTTMTVSAYIVRA